MSRNEEQSSSFCVHDGVILGGDDYAASVGATRTASNHELSYARQHVVAVTAAYELQAVDIVSIHYKDMDRCEAEAREGACSASPQLVSSQSLSAPICPGSLASDHVDIAAS